ncbi:MAG: hypothetical protein KAU21_00920, partial [Gammaproteobacteria bacterium]|nr:hypothetical protein [Gammaproteobacteria bacterium]
MKKIEQQEDKQTDAKPGVKKTTDPVAVRKKRPYLLAVFLFLIVLAIMTATGYQGWRLFTQNNQQTQAIIQQLQSELAERPTLSEVDKGINSIRQSVNQTDSRLTGLEQGQQSLTDSTEKLYELYGRDENGWKL